MKEAQTFTPINPMDLLFSSVYLPNNTHFSGRKTLIFDLDETLIYSPDNLYAAEVVINVNCPTGEVVRTGINIRPYAI